MKNLLSVVAALVTAFLLAVGPPAEKESSASAHARPTALLASAATTGSKQAQVDPEKLYHDAWKVIDDNFLYRDRLKNWSAWEHKFTGKLKTEADAVDAINQMLDSLKEDYTYYKSPGMVQFDKKRAAARNVVSYQLLPGDVGYIRIRTFSSENTADETEAALKALTKAGAKSLILDLRDNGGGYIHQSFEVFSLFVDSGTYTRLEGYYGGAKYSEKYVVEKGHLENIANGQVTKSTRRENLSGNLPLVILVNGDTASASEMLAGALRDHGRAKIVGTKTFGKGIAQIAPALSNGGAVRVTFAQYLFPKGGTIHGVGITPDSVVAPSTSGDAQLREGLDVLDRELKK